MTNDFLLNDKQVAMDDVLTACSVAAERCAEGADILNDQAGLVSALRRAAEQHREAADALREIVRSNDHLPREGNDEKELLTSLAIQLRAIVSPERATRVIDACLKSETDLLESIEKMSAFSLEPHFESCLEDLRKHARETVGALRQARTAADR